MKSRAIQAAVVDIFNSGPRKVGTLGISRVLSLRSAENRAPERVQSQIEDPGCGYGTPQPQLTGLHLVLPLQLALGSIGKCWPAQGPPDF